MVGTFIGFDDNRSLGQGETGAVAALPMFIEFMQEALKGYPTMDFTAPPDTVFAQVGPNREAFRPGTEPSAAVQLPAGGAVATPTVLVVPGGAPPPVPAKPADTPAKALRPAKPDDMTGLY